MNGCSKSLLAVKVAVSRSTSNSSRTGDWAATLRARTPDDVLVSLVRLLARQAGRETAERQPETDQTRPPRILSEKQS
jgi:hypothetical protein